MDMETESEKIFFFTKIYNEEGEAIDELIQETTIRER